MTDGHASRWREGRPHETLWLASPGSCVRCGHTTTWVHPKGVHRCGGCSWGPRATDRWHGVESTHHTLREDRSAP